MQINFRITVHSFIVRGTLHHNKMTIIPFCTQINRIYFKICVMTNLVTTSLIYTTVRCVHYNCIIYTFCNSVVNITLMVCLVVSANRTLCHANHVLPKQLVQCFTKIKTGKNHISTCTASFGGKSPQTPIKLLKQQPPPK